MKISVNYIAVVPLPKPEPKPEEFQTVEIQDESTFKGKVQYLPDQPVYMGNEQVKIGDTVLFAKYSPDTHDIAHDGQKVKFIKTSDLLAVL